MKVRLFFIVCTLLLGCGSLWAQKFTQMNDEGTEITYEVISTSAKTLKVTKTERAEHILIPATVIYDGETYTVTTLGDESVGGGIMRGFNKITTSVTLPSTLKVIEKNALHGIKQLTSLTIPEGVVEIGKRSIANNGELTSLVLPSTLLRIGTRAIAGNKNLTSISIPLSVKIIEDYAFDSNCGAGTSPKDWNFVSMPAVITESNCQKMGISKISVASYLAEHPHNIQQQSQVIYVQAPPVQQTSPQQQTVPTIESVKAPSSDVDTNLPDGAANNSNTFAVIIANEDYQEEVKVEYAQNDGEIFGQYCQKVLGMPEKNIHIRKNATLNNFKAELSWMKQVANAFNGDASFIVYYAGHGVPDEATRVAYLLPVDGKGTMLETGYSLEEFYQTLGAMPAKSITVFMDACFSGSKRGEGMLTAARGVVIEAEPGEPQGNMVVFSAAQGNETAYPYREKEHGLFTYFLLKKLKETNGNVSLGELSSYITQQVSRESIVTNGKSQTPSVNVSSQIGDAWKAMKLK